VNRVSSCSDLQVEGTNSKGRSRNMWNECVKVHMNRLGLINDDAHNRDSVEEFDNWKPSNTASVR